jgi:hypothetical protein
MAKGKKVSGEDYSAILEDYHRELDLMSRNMKRQPAGLSNNLKRNNKTGLKKPRLKSEKK